MQIETFQNESGNPIIRKCANCINWKPIDTNKVNGYCKLMPLIFAYTLSACQYAITKKHNLCEKHVLMIENQLKQQGIASTYNEDYLKLWFLKKDNPEANEHKAI